MNRDMWLGIARHILTLVGGVFVDKGLTDADTVNTIVGAVVSLGGVGWSIADKAGQ
jgi:hypothetical protein